MQYKYNLFISDKFVEGHQSLKEMNKAITKAKKERLGKMLSIKNSKGKIIYCLYILKDRKTNCFPFIN